MARWPWAIGWPSAESGRGRRFAVAPAALVALAVLTGCTIDGTQFDDDREQGVEDADRFGRGGPSSSNEREKLPDIQGIDSELWPTPVDAAVHGRVVDQSGTPVGDATVGASVDEDDTGLLVGLLFPLTAPFVFLGCALTACFDDPDFPSTGPSDGYDIVLPSAHYPGYEGNDDWTVSATADGRGTATQSFEVAAAGYQLPDLVLWSPTVQEEVDGTDLSITFDPLEVDSDGGVHTVAAVVTADGYGIVSNRVGDRIRLDVRLLEDFATDLVLGATWDHTQSPTIFHHESQAVPVRLAATAGPPSSRGAGCTVTTADGAVAPLSPCPITDGQLGTNLTGFGTCGEQPTAGCIRVSEVVVDLGTTIEGDLLVPRCWCDVAVSADGVAWTAAYPPAHADGSVTTDLAGAPVRYVRVHPMAESDGDPLALLAEVSVWAAEPLPPPPPPVGQDGDDAAGPASGSSDDDDRDRAIAAAVAVAALFIATAGLALVRRRRA